MEYKNIRNAYTTRVKKTVNSYLNTMRFGMRDYSQIERISALNFLVTKGLDRTASQFQVVKPLLHAMCIKREKQAKINKGQGDNMGTYVKDSEFVSMNGKCLNDCMTPHDVAMLILVIENNMTKSDIVSKLPFLSSFLKHVINMIYVIYIYQSQRESYCGLQIIENTQTRLLGVGVRKVAEGSIF